MADFDRANAAAIAFDTQLQANASQYSSEYADLVALVARQVFASMDITIGFDNVTNTFSPQDVKIYMQNFDPVGISGG